MLIRNVLRESDIVLDVQAPDKVAVLARAAVQLARRTGLDHQTINDALVAREQTGSTGFGAGIAIPHALIGGISAPAACFLRLNQPAAYDAIDDRPVGMAFGLLWPKQDARGFLPGLAQVARILRDGPMRKLLRSALTPAAALAYLDQGVEAEHTSLVPQRPHAGQGLYFQFA